MEINSGLTIVAEWAEVSGTSLNTLVGSRVAKRRKPEGFDNTTKAIVISSQGMGSEPSAPVQEDSYVFHCYGGTEDADDAEAVFQAVFSRFQMASGTTTTGGIVLSELVSAFPSVDPPTGWPVHVAIFHIKTT